MYASSFIPFRTAACEFTIHRRCLKTAPKNCSRSPQKTTANKPPVGRRSKEINKIHFEHYWIEGSIPMTSICSICNTAILFYDGFECARCEQLCHTSCAEKLDRCKPRHKNLIYIPEIDHTATCDKSAYYDGSSKRSPLLVLINPRSGGHLGEQLQTKLSYLLSPEQVFTIGSQGPTPILQKFKDVPNLKVLVAGGDGTVGWVMNCIDELKFDPRPPIAILPLGTGNDLSRTLGWGSGYTDEPLSDILNHIEHSSNVAHLDRWKIKITPNSSNSPIVETIMNNYMSIGIDAKVALDFHTLRKEYPDMCASQWMNRFWYATYGIKAMFTGLEDLGQIMKLEIDGKEVKLPNNVEGIILLNIKHYAGGATTLWGEPCEGDGFVPPRIDDHLLEVAAITSSFHIGQISLELSSAIRIRQGTNIKMTLLTRSPMPVQIDGEPSEIHEVTIEVSHHGQALLLEKSL